MQKHTSPRLFLVSSGEEILGEDKPGGHLSGGVVDGAAPLHREHTLVNLYFGNIGREGVWCEGMFGRVEGLSELTTLFESVERVSTHRAKSGVYVCGCP